jgi:outer membrane protein OmpA-like peptidoglycan-associated protein
MKLLTLFCLLLIVFVPISKAQNEDASRLNGMSHAFGVTAEGGATYAVTDYSKTNISFTGKASFEYFLPSTGAGNFGFRIFAQQGYAAGSGIDAAALNPTDAFETKFDMLGGGVSYILSMGDAVYPLFSAGVAHMWFYPQDNNGGKLPGVIAGGYKNNVLSILGDLGVRFQLSKSVSLNVAAGVIVSRTDFLDDYRTGSTNDMVYTGTVGVTYYFGRDKDADGDGVPDTDDACPNTPQGVSVDEFGCPLDADKDGIPDYLDKCADTPKGAKVDGNGCPIDSDKDGVPDYMDKCANTPAGVNVDKNGCPLDADGDGVPDYLDKCPNTPKGTEVTADGCPIVKEKEVVIITKPAVIEKIVLSGDTNFENNRATLLPSAYAALAAVVTTMKENPDYKWEVGGHTDAVGSDASNMKLSRLRAQAVIDYLVRQGVKGNNLTMVGYGESAPIATNETQEGKAMNRRVEIKLLSK